MNFKKRIQYATILAGCLSLSAPVFAPSSGYAHTPAPVISSAQGQQVLLNTVRQVVQANPVLADGVGNKALLVSVKQAVMHYPELEPSIVSAAKALRPKLAVSIENTAQVALQARGYVAPPTPTMQSPAMVDVVPPAAPASTAATASAGSAAAAGVGGNTALWGAAGLAGLAGVALAVEAIVDPDDGESLSAADFETTEYTNQYGLAAINASTAYARGANGAGVKVAVIDTGLLVTHEDIDDNVDPNGYDTLDDDDDVADGHGHGTHVSGIIAAERSGGEESSDIHGVAYNATVLPIRVLGDDGSGSWDAIAAGAEYAAAQGAQVLNASLGPDYSDPSYTEQVITSTDQTVFDAYETAANSDVILVFASGNDYEENPTVAVNPTGGGIYPYIKPANADTGVYDDSGADYDFSSLEGMLLTVVAVDDSGEIASFSNRCGVAAAWCLAAPGVNILSLGNDGGEALYSGTSQAAPHVSGAVAVLLDMFPELTPQEIVERILISADKSGDFADEEIYGQGMLDLGNATQPIGSLSVAMGDNAYGESVELKHSNMNLGPAFGDGLRAALVGQKLAVFDQQKATFLVDLADFTHTADSRFDLDAALNRFRSRFDSQTLSLGNGREVHYTLVEIGSYRKGMQDPALGDKSGSYAELSYAQDLGGGLQFNAAYNVNPSNLYGIYQTGIADVNATLSRDAFSAPYLSFAKQGYSAGTAMKLGGNFTVRMGGFQGHSEADELRAEDDRAETFGQMLELAYAKGAWKLFTQVGMLTEKSTFLGSRSEGAFDLSGGTHTSFAGFNGVYQLSGTWNLVGSYYRGISSPKIDSRSLFSDVSEVGTESFSLGVLGNDVLREGDQMGLLGNQPLRVTDGEASLSLATGRTRGGNVFRQDYDMNLSPTGRELNLEAFYHMHMENELQLMSSMLYRTQPGHVREAADEAVFLMQLQRPF